MTTFVTLIKFSREGLKNMGDLGSVYEEGVKIGKQEITAYITDWLDKVKADKGEELCHWCRLLK